MRIILAAAMILGLSGVAQAQYTGANPFVTDYGRNNAVTVVEIHYRDGALPSYQDSAAANYVAHGFNDERRAAFNTFAEARGLTRETTAERMGEFLAEADMRSRVTSQTGGEHHLKVVATVTSVNAPSMLSLFVPTTNITPTIDADFTISDADTGATMAVGHIAHAPSIAGNIEEAARRDDLHYNWSGTDQHFRTLAGQANALVNELTMLIMAPQLPIGRANIGTAPLPGGVMVPITVAYGEYQITVTPPRALTPATPPLTEAPAAPAQTTP